MLRVSRTRQPAYEVPTSRVHLAKDGQHSQLQSVRRPRRLPEPPRTLKTFRNKFSCETESNNVDKQWLWFEGTLSCYPTKGNRPFISAQLYSQLNHRNSVHLHTLIHFSCGSPPFSAHGAASAGGLQQRVRGIYAHAQDHVFYART